MYLKRIILMVFCSSVLHSAPVLAKPEFQDSFTCAQMMATKGKNLFEQTLGKFAVIWASAYVTGYMEARSQTFDNALFATTFRTHCQDNPDDTIRNATEKIVLQLSP